MGDCLATIDHTTTHHNRFTALFPRPPGWAYARRELLAFMAQGRINRGRHIDHRSGCHSIQTNHCPPPPPAIFYRPDALPATQPTVSKHWRHNRHGPKIGRLCPFRGGAGSPSNTMWPGPRPTSLPNGILIHPAVWHNRHGPEIGGGCAPFSGERELGPHLAQNNVAWARDYLHVKRHLDPSNRSVTIHQRHIRTGQDRTGQDRTGQTTVW